MNKLLVLILFGLIFIASSVSSAENTYPAIGETTPSCNVQSLTSDTTLISTNQYSGKVILIDFWASWCEPCRKSFAVFNQLNNRYRESGLQIIAIGVDEKKSDAEFFLKKYPANFTIGLDSTGKCPRNFAVKGMPYTYLIDRNGIIREIQQGFRTDDIAELEKTIEKLLAEKNDALPTMSDNKVLR